MRAGDGRAAAGAGTARPPAAAGAATGPQTLAELLAAPGVTEVLTLRSRFGFMAIHAGDLEAATDVVAAGAAAAAGASYYGVVHPPGHDHHLASIRYRAEESAALTAFLAHVEVVVSVHGYGRRGRWTSILAGGTNRSLAEHVAGHVGARLTDHDVVTDLGRIPRELRGTHPRNPVNQPLDGGVQLELPPRVRGLSPLSPPPGPDGLSPLTRRLIDALAAAARSWPPSGRPDYGGALAREGGG